jgi:hypothetical protein
MVLDGLREHQQLIHVGRNGWKLSGICGSRQNYGNSMDARQAHSGMTRRVVHSGMTGVADMIRAPRGRVD